MMDVSSEGFASDYYEFRQEIKELERRLSSLLVQAFDDAACMQARFNLLDSFKALLERPNIESEIEKRIMTLISNYGIGKYSSEGAAREWSTVVIVIVIFIS